MSDYLKIIAAILITVVLGLIISKQAKDFFVLISVTGAVFVMVGAISYLKPVVNFISRVSSVGKLDSDLINTILKAVGIGLISELVCLICADSGQSAMGKTVHIFSGSVILWLSLPLFTKLLELIENVLGAI